MDIYIISARSILGEYTEKIELYPNMEDKPKSYIGYGKRIDKRKVGKVEEGMFRGGYQTVVTSEAEIEQARRSLKKQVGIYVNDTFKKAKADKEALDNYSIEEHEVKIKNILD